MRLVSVRHTNMLRSSYFLLVPLAHTAVLAFTYFILVRMGVIGPIDYTNFIKFDAGWYATIVSHGYDYGSATESNTAFFPLFPYVWRLLIWATDSIWTICLFNSFLFTAGLYILKKVFEFSWTLFLVFLSLPTMMFMMVPYTEGLFFFFSALFLGGLRTGNRYMMIGGLFLAGITRPVAMFFIPVLIMVEIFTFRDLRTFFRNVLQFVTVPLLSLTAVFTFQYVQTGKWFGFWNVHSKIFYHKFAWPEFPLNTWGGPRILWHDGFAFFFAMAAVAALIIVAVRRLRKSEGVDEPQRPQLFSMGYLAVTGLYILFFNGRDSVGGTTLVSADRYITATAYFAVFVHWLAGSFSRDTLLRIACFVLLLLTFVSYRTFGVRFASYNTFELFTYRLLFAINIGLYVISMTGMGRRLLPLVYIFNVPLQLILLHHFAQGEWVG